MRAKRTWIFIGDGVRARIVANDGPGTGLSPVPKRTFARRAPPTKEIGADRPSTRGAPAGARHGVAPKVDWHRVAKQGFARQMAEMLNEAAGRKAFDRLVVVAPPESLGEIRRALTKTTRERVIAEIDKDLTHVSDHELPGYLGGALVL